MSTRPYTYYELTRTLCHHCRKLCDAKIIFQDDNVYMIKTCLKAGCPGHNEKVLIATDIDYYKLQKEYYKPGDMPDVFNTQTLLGCPRDCGICEDHEQHACLSIVEITDQCNMQCPICFAGSGPKLKHKSLEDIEKMFDVVCANEAEPDIVQISGGEPTIHPDFFEILDRAKKRPFRYLMVNTNGIRIAQDEEFVKRLATYCPDFEIYLQFDSFKPEVLKELRGYDTSEQHRKALENLEKYNIPTTLVVVTKQGKNDDECGAIIDYGLTWKCVRGVTFQPIQIAGRVENFNPVTDRITLTDVRKNILKQTNVFTADDIVPLPCHPENISMGYALRMDGKVMPLGRYISKEDLVAGAKNSIIFENNPAFTKHFYELFSLASQGEKMAHCFGSLLCCLPQIKLSRPLGYENVFRVLIISFMDFYDFDVRSVKRSCIQFPRTDGKMYPFDTFNLLYRANMKS